MTVRPSATMTLYSGGRVVNDKSVTLSQRLRMDLKLDSSFLDDFDIEARYCTAATIPVIRDFCPRDEALFPNFQKIRHGFIRNEFGAFRVTTLEGGAVEMVFTCVLKVCLGNCSRPSCEDGTGRRKRSELWVYDENEADDFLTNGLQSETLRHSRVKRQAKIKDITVGAKVRVVTRKVVNEDDDEDEICIDPNMFYGMMAGAGAALGATIIASMLLRRKEKKQNKALVEQGPPTKQQRRRKR
ncbi:hypothetical protein FSP39_018282 [Pinctada imbricata]|uniref:ZP domain-containing protein n=1 Tax=Pinctada imbricata TaxID=66713 RepID=A0AA88YDU2_PINIB|nr:hypothetical protein FSP39_018282 [Pinctada imbricata]